MTLAEALAQILPQLAPAAGQEEASLEAAVGRILAEDVVSPIDVPGGDNAAVDGYAVYFEDLEAAGPTALPIAGRAAAGHPFTGRLSRGAALRIFTGAPMPAGPDTVVMQEDCRIEEGRVILPAGIKRGINRRRAGEDVRAGATVLAAGARLRPQDVGLAAAVGRRRLTVARRLRVALCAVGAAEESSRHGLGALLRQLGAEVIDRGVLPAPGAALEAALAAAADGCDAIVAGGGDAMGQARRWEIAADPIRTMALGEIGGAVVIGLPGRPAAAKAAFLCLARPILLRLAGARELEARRYPLRAGFAYEKPAGRRALLYARLAPGSDGAPVAHLLSESSGPLGADGMVDLPEALTRVEPGSMVAFLPFGEAG